MNIEPDECVVICQDCNGYLYAKSIYESPNGKQIQFSRCPFKCKYDFDGKISMTVPEGWGQQYGRS